MLKLYFTTLMSNLAARESSVGPSAEAKSIETPAAKLTGASVAFCAHATACALSAEEAETQLFTRLSALEQKQSDVQNVKLSVLEVPKPSFVVQAPFPPPGLSWRTHSCYCTRHMHLWLRSPQRTTNRNLLGLVRTQGPLAGRVTNPTRTSYLSHNIRQLERCASMRIENGRLSVLLQVPFPTHVTIAFGEDVVAVSTIEELALLVSHVTLLLPLLL